MNYPIVKLLVVLIALANTIAAPSASHADVAKDKELGYRLVLPDGFTLDPENRESGSTYRGLVGEGVPTLIRIEPLRRSLDDYDIDESVSQMSMRADQAERRTAEWMGEEITVLAIYSSYNGLRTLEKSALIPLVPEALRLTVVGPAENEVELGVLLSQLLNGLEGESATKEASGLWLKGLLGGLLLVVIGVWWAGAKREAFDDFFAPSDDETDQSNEDTEPMESMNYVCKVCGLESESGAFCPECIAETMVRT